MTKKKKFNILVVGDSCIDGYCYGTCERLSPEAPVPILKLARMEQREGMAANVKNNLEALGVLVTFKTNKEIISKVRFIDEKYGQHLIRVDEDTLVEQWDGADKLNLTRFDAIVISDYNKGFISYNTISSLRRRFEGPIFLDTKKQDLAQFHGIFVKINEIEYKNRYSINDSLIVTLGKSGAMYKKFNDEKFYDTPKVDVVDVCGAGDTFLSAFAFKYLETGSIDDAINFANKAASITIQHMGTYAPTLGEIE